MLEIMLFKGEEEIFWDEINVDLTSPLADYFPELDGRVGVYYFSLLLDGIEVMRSKPLRRTTVSKMLREFHDRLVEEGNLAGAECVLPAMDALKPFSWAGVSFYPSWSLSLVAAGLFLVVSCCRMLMRVIAGIFFPHRFKLEAMPLIVVVNMLLLIFMIWGISFLYKRISKKKG